MVPFSPWLLRGGRWWSLLALCSILSLLLALTGSLLIGRALSFWCRVTPRQDTEETRVPHRISTGLNYHFHLSHPSTTLHGPHSIQGSANFDKNRTLLMYELDLKLEIKLILKTKLGRFVLLCIIVWKFAVCNSKKLKHKFLLSTISYSENTFHKQVNFFPTNPDLNSLSITLNQTPKAIRSLWCSGPISGF